MKGLVIITIFCVPLLIAVVLLYNLLVTLKGARIGY